MSQLTFHSVHLSSTCCVPNTAQRWLSFLTGCREEVGCCELKNTGAGVRKPMSVLLSYFLGSKTIHFNSEPQLWINMQEVLMFWVTN